MGNHRFRLSDMIPNAWFYKLRDMNTRRTRNFLHPKKRHSPSSPSSTTTTTTTFYHHNPNLSSPRQSYYTTESIRCYNLYNSPEGASSFSDPPKRKTVYKPSENQIAQTGTATSSSDDDSTTLPELDLPPILTKPVELTQDLTGLEESINLQPRKSFSKSTGVKLRTNSSPRIANKKIRSHARRGVPQNKHSVVEKELSASVAMVKPSLDPQEDFRESMMEMIVENNIKASRELEDLLACYLSLNSDEYHHLIIKAFEQIWFDLQPHLHL